MGNLDHLSDDECRAMLESISEAMEGEEREYVHPSGEREEMNLAENVHALRARVAALEAALVTALDAVDQAWALCGDHMLSTRIGGITIEYARSVQDQCGRAREELRRVLA